MIDEEARTFLSSAALGAVWARAARHLSRNGVQATGTLRLDLDVDQARALQGLLGRLVSPGRVRVDVAELDRALRTSRAGLGLVAAIEMVTGEPVRDAAADRARLTQARAAQAQALDDALARAGLGQAPWVGQFADQVRASGMLARPDADHFIAHLQATLTHLEPVLRAGQPASETPWGLAQLASLACGSAHGLDDGTPIGALTLRAAALALGRAAPVSAAERRALWAAMGVATDTVSATVACWGLRPPGSDRWSSMMRTRADLGLVTHLTLAELTGALGPIPGPLTAPGQRVYCCENPQVLQAAAAQQAGAAVVCLFGNPTTTGWALLDALVASGAEVGYHGDFDWPGVAITARVLARGASPWQMGAADYLRHARSGTWQPLTGDPVDTGWDPDLREVMVATGLAVHEEGALDALLDDLRTMP